MPAPVSTTNDVTLPDPVPYEVARTVVPTGAAQTLVEEDLSAQ
jgi:hypothetical protein